MPARTTIDPAPQAKPTRAAFLCGAPPILAARAAEVGGAPPSIRIEVPEMCRRYTALVIRGVHVFKGYWEYPEETAAKLRPGAYPWESVLYTGDLFKADEDGFLYFVGRKDRR